MRHNKWLAISAIAGLLLLVGCEGCEGDPPVVTAQGRGAIIEHDAIDGKREVETTTLEWGPQLVDTRVERKVVVKNLGIGILEVTAIEKAPGFDEVSFNYEITNFNLEAQQEQELTFYFEPKTDGAHTGVVRLKLAQSENTELVINLSGRGVKGGCVVTPVENVDFGSVALGTSFPMQVKIQNITELDWTVNVEGLIAESDKGTFSLTNFTPGKMLVPKHGDIVVPIEFKPNHVGPHQAALSISEPAMCAVVLPLIGQGVDQVLECEPKVLVKNPVTGQEKWECLLDFGYVNPSKDGKAKAPGEVTFKNLGNTPITVSGLGIEQESSKGNAFAKDDAEQVELVVEARQSAKVKLSFGPSVLGKHEAKLRFTSNDAKRPTGYFLLNGIGGGPAIEVQPTRLDFGSVAVDTFQRRRITIANVGTNVVGITDDNLKLMEPDSASAITCTKNTDCVNGNTCLRGLCWLEKRVVIEPSDSEFSVEWPPEGYAPTGLAAPCVNPGSCTGTEANQNADLRVKFAPKVPGRKLAQLKIFSNDPYAPVTVVPLEANGVTMPPCDYDVVPPQVNFGNVEPGKSLQLSFNIRNKSTNPADKCLVSTLGFARGTDPAFTLVKGPINDYEIEGGKSLEIPVRFSPKLARTYSGAVEFYISSKDAPEGRVALAGSAQTGCLLIAPNELDFGVIQINCNSRERVFTVYNVCSKDQIIESIDLQTGLSQEFHIIQKPRLPYTLAPGNSTDFKAKYAPTDMGDDQGSIALKTSQMVQPTVIPISGRGDTTAIQEDIFAQDPQPKVDVLFVIDSSGSMSDKQTNLGNNFDSFIKFAAAQQVDYHIAVTTTGVDEAHGGLTDSGDDLNGCFFKAPGNDDVITLETPNAETVFKQNVKVGTSGNYLELLIRPAYLALTNPNLTSCSKNFLRDEANLAIVVVSDAADQDDVPTSFYLNAFFTIKGFKRQNMFTFNGIVPKTGPVGSCSYDESDAHQNLRVSQVVQASAGVSDEICTPNWATTLEKLGQTAFGYRTRFFLSNVPDTANGQITITVDGVPYPEKGPYDDTRWSFNSAATAIDFDALSVPEPGSTIAVSYHVACLQ